MKLAEPVLCDNRADIVKDYEITFIIKSSNMKVMVKRGLRKIQWAIAVTSLHSSLKYIYHGFIYQFLYSARFIDKSAINTLN